MLIESDYKTQNTTIIKKLVQCNVITQKLKHSPRRLQKLKIKTAHNAFQFCFFFHPIQAIVNLRMRYLPEESWFSPVIVPLEFQRDLILPKTSADQRLVSDDIAPEADVDIKAIKWVIVKNPRIWVALQNFFLKRAQREELYNTVLIFNFIFEQLDIHKRSPSSLNCTQLLIHFN